jgi:hypothetical protein
MTINWMELFVRRVSSPSAQFAGSGDYKAGNTRSSSPTLSGLTNWFVVDLEKQNGPPPEEVTAR